MINFNELSTKLQNILNGIDSETLSITNPLSAYQFKTNIFGSHLDSIADKNTKKNVFPIFISNEEGNIDPVKALKAVESNFTIYFYYPAKYKDDFNLLPEYLLNIFVGKILNYGLLSGYAISNISVPEFSQLERQQMKQFRDDISSIYNLPVDETQIWLSMSVVLTLNQYANLGKANGFIVGNQITDTLSFTDGGTTYSENLVYLNDETSHKSDCINQQDITETETSSLSKNSSKTTQLEVYMRDNTFWNKFIELFENGEMQNREFTFTRTYNLTTNHVYTHTFIVDTINSLYVIGELSYATLIFVKKASVITYGSEL